MKKEKIYYFANHDNTNEKPVFIEYTLVEYNEIFKKNYASIDKAIEADPEYIFNEEQMLEYIS